MLRSRIREAPISGSERGDAGIDERIGQHTGIRGVIEDLIDGEQLRHRSNFRQVHPRNMHRRQVNSGRRGMEVDRVVGVGLEQPVEQYPGVPRRGGRTALIARPLAI